MEESPPQIIRNMRSVGIDLKRWVDRGLLRIEAARPSAYGLEMHLVRMHHIVSTFHPKVVIIDPISSLLPGGSQHDVTALVLRMVDFIKQRGATALFTALAATDDLQSTELSISSLVDTWIQLRNVEVNGERNRLLYVLKSRGMAHSNQVREFLMTSRGIRLRDVYLGPGGVLTGSARVAQEAEEQRNEIRVRTERERRGAIAQAELRNLEAKIAALQLERDTREKELASVSTEEQMRKKSIAKERAALSRSRSILGNGAAKRARENGGAKGNEVS